MVWSMALEFFARLFMLDIGWLIQLVADNLIVLFIFLAVAFFMFNDKKLLPAFLFFTIMMWVSLDLSRALGWVILAPAFLGIHYLSKQIVLCFAESDESLSKHLLVINTIQFVSMFAIYNLFLR